MNQDELNEIQDLARQGMSVRAIARRLGRDPKTVRRALGHPPRKPGPPKLDPFKDAARDLFVKGLFAPRILRDLRAQGYTGSLTILKGFLRTLGPKRKPARKAARRFETRPAQEAQVDWSPYRLLIGGQETVVHCLSMILCFSRRLWIGFFRNERLPTLLWAHVEAFRYHDGLCHRTVYDNQTCVTLGRVAGKPLWNPTFLEFARFYGFEPRVGRPRHPERRGKVERPFFYVETDFLRGSTFDSFDDLNQKGLVWLDTVANVRLHSTTGRLVHEAYAEERPFLIRPPETPFPTERREVRKVQKDGYVPVDGSFYPVPDHLVGQYVSVRVYPTHVEVLDATGAVAARHKVPDRPARLATDWGPTASREAPLSRTALEAAFLAHFPGAADFLDGLKRRMKTLAPIHLRQIERLVDLYGERSVGQAVERARDYRNYNAGALRRILEMAHPNVVPEPAPIPLVAGPEAIAALDDVQVATPDDYTLDSQPPTEGGDHGEED